MTKHLILILFTFFSMGATAANTAEQPARYLPHFTFRDGWESVLSLNNCGLHSSHVVVSAYDHEGNLDATETWILHPGETVKGPINQLMPELDAATGWMVLTGADIEGLVTFHRRGSHESTSLPLPNAVSKALLFPVVLQSQMWETGLSVVNTSERSNRMVIELLTPDGRVLSVAHRVLQPREKLVAMVSDIFDTILPETSQLRIVAEEPMTGFALNFGVGQIVAVPAALVAGAFGEEFSLSELSGLWQRHGYDQYIEVTDTYLMLHESTHGDCYYDSTLYPLEFLVDFSALRLHDGSISFQMPTDLVRQRWIPVDSIPPACDYEAVGDDPEANFLVFWKTFERHYSHFELREVDWQAVFETYYPQINPDTTDEQLYAIFHEMIALFDDPHVALINAETGFIDNPFEPKGSMISLMEEFETQTEYATFDTFRDAIVRQQIEHIKTTYLDGVVKTACNDHIQWGTLNESTGYLMIDAMEDYERSSSEPALEVLFPALIEILQDFSGFSSMVIDVRFNPGGYDIVSQFIASFFASDRRLAFSKRARTPDGFSQYQSVWTQIAEGVGFEGDVFLLTSPMTASAAEIFTMFLRNQDHVTVVGEATSGGFSDVLIKRLPNGLYFSISNEIYTLPDGYDYEGIGLAPDIEIMNFSREDRLSGRDSLLETIMDSMAP